MYLRDWTFVLAQPTTPRELICAQSNLGFSAKKDIPDFIAWRRQFLDNFDRVFHLLEDELGLLVVRYPTARAYARLLHDNRGVIVFSHSDGERLEFRDGMVRFEDVAAHIRGPFSGIAEICACEAIRFQPILKDKFPDALVRVSEVTLTDVLWITAYARFLAEFVPGPTTHIQAALATIETLRASLDNATPGFPTA